MTAARFKPAVLALLISAVSCAVHAQGSSAGGRLSCIAAEKDAEGEWIATRDLNVSDGTATATRDRYEWRSANSLSFGPGMTLKWELDYDWPREEAARKTVREDRVAAILHFRFDAQAIGKPLKKPERSWIHFYRSTDPEERFSVSTSSLTSIMFWDKFDNGDLSTKAVVPLDHLLAFGTGFDTLVWNIRTAPDQFGATQAPAKGVIPIASLRGKVAKIPKLRLMLDKKSANFGSECHAPIMMTSG